ncbi:MAG TPA: hypothetical protein VGH36_12395 [Acetobacteraceae bacterium]
MEGNVNHHAAGDGFLSAWIEVFNGGDGAGVYANTDGDSDPRIRRASAGVHVYGMEAVPANGLVTPVRAGAHYGIGYAPRWGSPRLAASFQPFPLSFGPWEIPDFNRLYPKRDEDGFVVASLGYTGGIAIAAGPSADRRRTLPRTPRVQYTSTTVRTHASQPQASACR